ncbi:COG4977 Transcriptional regulator containing an amidase domain and an AraC-type DNA-binding HTH domain [Sphingomonadaceae bacterium]|jgi:transcriptional regulator GlxA family with amidase domain
MSRLFTFLLLPGYSMMSLAAAVEPLRSLNRLTGVEHYSWKIASLGGGMLAASNNIPIPTEPIQDALVEADYVIVCGGLRIPGPEVRAYAMYLMRAVRQGSVVGAISTASLLLARAGLLDGHRCTVHWESRTTFEEEFPDIECSDRLFEIDGKRLTCSGGTASMDLMLFLIAEQHGQRLAQDVANQFQHSFIRGRKDSQRGGRHEPLAQLPHTLRAAIEIMLANLEDPLPLSAIAEQVGVSPRQIERMFQRHVKMKPSLYYMRLRVERARDLLVYSDLRVIDAAVAAGFKSSSHLSTWYRRLYGVRPSEIRETHADGSKAKSVEH